MGGRARLGRIPTNAPASPTVNVTYAAISHSLVGFRWSSAADVADVAEADFENRFATSAASVLPACSRIHIRSQFWKSIEHIRLHA